MTLNVISIEIQQELDSANSYPYPLGVCITNEGKSVEFDLKDGRPITFNVADLQKVLNLARLI